MSSKYVPLEKRTKKQQQQYYKSLRVTNGQNTGVRNMDEGKTRELAKQNKKISKREIDIALTAKQQKAISSFTDNNICSQHQKLRGIHL